MMRSAGALFVFLFVLLVWQYLQSIEREKNLAITIAELKVQVFDLEQKLAALEAHVADLESQTLETQVRRANSELLEGWQRLLRHFQEGVDSSKKALEEKGLLPSAPQKQQEQVELERT
ncbi:hypothetical protein [Simiduia aestuariiviva]|uniref:CHASE3 domain sensor protein n=1 Tax=Simiduia aestuariiviva TaxID=1510459 RepID=A0A839UQP4_9GAMM|nr:hypothetical protein [Simiduia aestuariiviva]MBB3168166.1 CHASE3 domain sensor protein [Simiduia aestuariiviva]